MPVDAWDSPTALSGANLASNDVVMPSAEKMKEMMASMPTKIVAMMTMGKAAEADESSDDDDDVPEPTETA